MVGAKHEVQTTLGGNLLLSSNGVAVPGLAVPKRVLCCWSVAAAWVLRGCFSC